MILKHYLAGFLSSSNSLGVTGYDDLVLAMDEMFSHGYSSPILISIGLNSYVVIFLFIDSEINGLI